MDGPKRIFQNNGGVISLPSNEEFPFQHGIGAVLFDRMREFKPKIAQIDATTGEKDTYESLLQRCIRTAIKMRLKGVTSKDIITVCSSNHLNTCVPLIASLFLGVKYANTDPRLSLSDTAFLLNQVRPKLVFVSADGVQLIEDALRQIGLAAEIVIFGESSKHTQFSEFLVASNEEEHFKPVDIEDMKTTAAIFFSSGTTGLPKGICVRHMSLLAQALNYRDPPPFPMVMMTYSSAYWISLSICFIDTIIAGACLIAASSFEFSTLWSYIEKYKVTMLVLTPTQVATVCQYGRPDGVDTSSLMFCGAGGSTLSAEQVQTMRKVFHGSLFFTGYGQTELGGGALTFNAIFPEDLQLTLQKPTSCGRPMAGFLVKVVNPETEEILGPNQPGEIRVKTEYVMNGYYNVDSTSCWDSDGFLKTGDIAYYEEDYCFHIMDRLKEMLKYQGWQIAPAKLEGILMTHPAVECAAVVGLPNPIDGDHPAAVVTLDRSIDGKVTAEEIQKYFEDKVSDKEKLRGGLKIVKSIPLTPTGKFKRREIRDMILSHCQ